MQPTWRLHNAQKLILHATTAPQTAPPPPPHLPLQSLPAHGHHLPIENVSSKKSLGQMLDEFDELCGEGESTDPKARYSHDVHEDNSSATDVVAAQVQSVVLGDDQCSWCGFRDHNRRTRSQCPQHKDYDGDVYQKGDKINDAWVPGTRASHNNNNNGDRRRLTPTSVRSAPLANSWTVKDWTVGVGTIDARSKFEPGDFTGQSVLTYPKLSLS